MNPVEQQQQAGGPRRVITYASVVEANRRATLALVWGVLGIVPVVFPGILAIRYGRRGGRDAAATGSGGGRARAGVVLGVIGLLWSAFVIASVPPAIVRARRQAQMVYCASQLRQIGMGCLMYASANGGWTPPSLAVMQSSAGVRPMTCPGGVSAGVANPGYILALPSTRLATISSPATTVLAYEPPTNHGGRGINVLYVDGHVAWLPGAARPPVTAGGGAAGGVAPTTVPAGQ
jgi:prepilin-type processing-associated H-X9-DG protein